MVGPLVVSPYAVRVYVDFRNLFFWGEMGQKKRVHTMGVAPNPLGRPLMGITVSQSEYL